METYICKIISIFTKYSSFFFLLKLTEKAQIQRCNLVISVNRSEVVIISINMTKHETTEAGGKTCNFHRHLTELSCKS